VKTWRHFSFSGLILFVFLGCSLNYRDAQVLDELEDTVPNIRMTGITHTVASKDRVLMIVTADKSESYEKAKKTILLGVEFKEYDSRGDFVAEGRADKVVYRSDSKNAEIEGNIIVHSYKEKGGLRADYLFWNDEQRTLKGREDLPITLTDDDGSKFTGRGFEADLKRVIISFLSAVEGDYVVSDLD
jgi:LPS export ABC transporter protein LptC